MLKVTLKWTCLGVLILATQVLANTASSLESTLSFSTNATTTLDSTMATVVVTIKSTTIGKDSHSQQILIMKQLQDYAPDVKWRVISMGQQVADSGAKNLTLKVWAQIPQTLISSLNQKIDQAHSGYKMTLMVMNYDPSDSAVQQAKQDLMIQLYQQIKTYVMAFNQATQENYRVQTVRFSTLSPQPVHAFLLLAKTNSVSSAANSEPVPVTKAIQLNAFVTLSQSGQQSSAKPIGQGVLPPAYLQVKNFKDCLSTEKRGTWKAWCMPSSRPKACPAASWKQLQDSSSSDGLSSCH